MSILLYSLVKKTLFVKDISLLVPDDIVCIVEQSLSCVVSSDGNYIFGDRGPERYIRTHGICKRMLNSLNVTS